MVAAQSFLAIACLKRKNTLDPVMAFCNQVLNGERDARKKDGVLNVIGQVAETLMKVQYRIAGKFGGGFKFGDVANLLKNAILKSHQFRSMHVTSRLKASS